MVEYFPNLKMTINPQIQGAQWTLSKRNLKKNIPRHIIIKVLKNNDKKISKAAIGREGRYEQRKEARKIRRLENFLSETRWAKRHWSNNFKVLRDKNSTYISIPSKNIFQKQWQNKDFSRHTKVKRFHYPQISLKMLKEVLQVEGKWHQRETWVYTKNEEHWEW